MERWQAFGGELVEAGAFIAGEGLQESATATTVRVGDGDERVVTDGPFAETKEQLGGFYLIECENLDEALEWAKKVPGQRRRRSRSGRSWTTTQFGYEDAAGRGGVLVDGISRRRRPPVPGGVGTGGRDPDPRPRRLRPRRGGGPGGVRGRARALAGDGVPPTRAPGSSARAQPGDRPAAPRAAPWQRSAPSWRRLEALRVERADRPTRASRSCPDDRLRLIFTCCHPALAPEAQVALTLRTLGGLTTAGDRARVPRPRAHDGAAARARQAQDPRRADPLPGPRADAAAGAARRRAGVALPRLQRGLLALGRRLADPARALRARRSGSAACSSS